MTTMPGRATTGQEDIRVCSTHVRPLHVELPGSVGKLAELSAASLGWSGSVLPPIKLLGRYVVPVAELVPEAHAERLCVGSEPVLDRTEISTWVWPEMEGRVPPPAARVVGMLAPARHWRSALTAAVPFARFTNTALVIPKTLTDGVDFMSTCLIRARHFGVAVLSASSDTVREELAGRSYDEAPPVEHTAVSRWVNEVIYQQLLVSEARAPSQC